MKGVTHLLIGACIGVQLVHDDPLLMQATGAICAAAALLPDVDHPQSLIRNRSGIIGSLLFGGLKHRGFTHSLAALALISVAAALLIERDSLAVAVAAGYASHLCADMVTMHGIALFAPFSARRVGLGMIRTGGSAEEFLAAGAMVFLLLVCGPVITGMSWSRMFDIVRGFMAHECYGTVCL